MQYSVPFEYCHEKTAVATGLVVYKRLYGYACPTPMFHELSHALAEKIRTEPKSEREAIDAIKLALPLYAEELSQPRMR